MYTINPMSIDAISELDDRELENRFRDVQRVIRKIKNTSHRVQMEEEFCYLYRERETRSNRSRLHKEYMQNLKPSNDKRGF